jgi:sulfate permease, SulP family
MNSLGKAGFLRDIWSIGAHLPETSIPTLLLALVMLALMLSLKHFAPKVPAPLVTVATGIAASAFAGLDKAGIALVGKVDAGLPSFTIPDLSLVEQLWPAALGIALMSFVETAAAGRAFVRRGDLQVDANRELMATGVANLAGSFFYIMPSGFGGVTEGLPGVACQGGHRACGRRNRSLSASWGGTVSFCRQSATCWSGVVGVTENTLR